MAVKKTLPRKNKILIGGLLLLSFLLLLPNFLPIHLTELRKEKKDWDTFRPEMVAEISSVDELVRRADSAAKTKGPEHYKFHYAQALDTLVRSRFYHGYSHYNLSQNWMTALTGKLVFKDVSAIVKPDDILKYPMAACSQQSMVMMEALRRKGIGYRKVAFNTHYALEANIDGKWYYFDTNTEPDFSGVGMTSFDSIWTHKRLNSMYAGRADSAIVVGPLRFKEYGPENAAPAKNATLFHNVTGWASKLLWLLPLATAFLVWKRR